jgi:hypothetical protein
MRALVFPALLLLLAPFLAAGTAAAQPAQPLDRLLPQIRRDHPGQFLDAEGANTGGNPHYHLKWLTPDGRVMWLDTDARTGRVLRQSPGRDSFDAPRYGNGDGPPDRSDEGRGNRRFDRSGDPSGMRGQFRPSDDGGDRGGFGDRFGGGRDDNRFGSGGFGRPDRGAGNRDYGNRDYGNRDGGGRGAGNGRDRGGDNRRR